MRIPLVGPPTSLVMLLGQPNLVVAFAQVICRPTRQAKPSVYRSRLGGQGVRLTGPGEYLGCYRSRTRPATITRCVHLSIRLLFADDNRLLRELQVSYDGFNDGKYNMVMAGHWAYRIML